MGLFDAFYNSVNEIKKKKKQIQSNAGMPKVQTPRRDVGNEFINFFNNRKSTSTVNFGSRTSNLNRNNNTSTMGSFMDSQKSRVEEFIRKSNERKKEEEKKKSINNDRKHSTDKYYIPINEKDIDNNKYYTRDKKAIIGKSDLINGKNKIQKKIVTSEDIKNNTAIFRTPADVLHRINATAVNAISSFNIGASQVIEGIPNLVEYGVAQIKDWSNKDIEANQTRKELSEGSRKTVKNRFTNLNEMTKQDTLLPDSAEKGIQMLGQYVAKGGLTAISPVLTDVASFSMDASNAMNEAYQKDGVTDKQAWLRGVSHGVTALMIEKSGGIFSKGTGIDKKIEQRLTKNMRTSLQRTLTRLGVQGVQEGTEEIIEYNADYMIDKIIDNTTDGATLSKAYDSEEARDSFTTALATSMIFGGVTTYSSINKISKDYNVSKTKALDIYSLKKDFEPQIVKIEQNRKRLEKDVNKLERQGKDNTEEIKVKKKKIEILDASMDCIKMNIKNYIEKVQKGKDQIFEEAVQRNELSDSSIRKENNISNIDSIDNTDITQNGISEVSEKITKNNNINEENLQYSIDNKSNLLENKFPISNKITEKDNIRTTAQRYFDMKKDTTKKIVDTIERFQDTRNKNATNGNLKIVFDDTVKGNGIITKDTNGNRLMRINPNSNKSYEFIVVHEMTHDLEGTAEYKELQEVVKEFTGKGFAYEQAKADLEKRYNEFYDKNGLDKKDLNIESEAMGDILGTVLGDQKFINEVSRKKPNVAKRIVNWINKFIDIHKSKGSDREFKEYLYKIKDSFRKAFEANNIVENKTNYSIQVDGKGNKYVKVDTDQDIFDGISEKDYNKIAKMYMQDYLKGEHTIAKNDKVEIGSKGINKYTNPQQNTAYFKEKMRLSTELKNVLEISQKVSSGVPTKSTTKFPNWEYYKINFEIGGKNFEGLINIGIDKNGDRKFYEINKIHTIRNIVCFNETKK